MHSSVSSASVNHIPPLNRKARRLVRPLIAVGRELSRAGKPNAAFNFGMRIIERRFRTWDESQLEAARVAYCSALGF